MITYTQGQRVRFTAENLGTVDPALPGVQMTEHVVNAGELGTVLVPPGSMPEGWLAVTADSYPLEYVPVHPGMIEPLEDADADAATAAEGG